MLPSLNLGSGSFNASTGDAFSTTYRSPIRAAPMARPTRRRSTMATGRSSAASRSLPERRSTPAASAEAIYTPTGDKTVTVTVFDTRGVPLGAITAHVSLGVLHVTNFVQDTSGFDVTFDRAVNTSVLNLYDGVTLSNQTNLLGSADLTLVGQNTGLVNGSLVWNAATNTATFVANSILSGGMYTRLNGQLPADTYTVTLFSRANGWVDTGGGLLNGGTTIRRRSRSHRPAPSFSACRVSPEAPTNR